MLYWLRDFRLDGLRFDAIDQIEDGSNVHILEEIAQTVRKEIINRHVHLITEDPGKRNGSNGRSARRPILQGRLERRLLPRPSCCRDG